VKAFWPFLCMIVLLLPARSTTAQEEGTIASIVGEAEVFRAGQWQPAKLRQSLLPGDVVKTGPGSRVAILLGDESQIKVNANSTLEIKQVGPPPGRPIPVAFRLLQTILNLLSGEIWIRSRVEPFEIQTPAATATIRGTEMNLSIAPADAARLAVLEGAVEFRNPQGSVLVAAGEQATAKVGEAPRKTVLVNPLDAVQWSFYYPGIVSFRDYPLTAIGPALLPQRLTQAEGRVAAAPGNLEARIELGEILFDLGRRAEARREFERALAIAPQDPRARAGLGWVNLVEGKVEAALGEFRQARPPTLPALVGMTNALYRLDRFEEAEAVIAEAKRRFPSSPQPWTQAALLHLIQGRASEALSELEQALALDPRHALAYGLLSNVYLVQNEKGLALQAAEQAIAANPFSPSAHLDLSLVKQAEFRLEEALQAAQQAVALDPEDPQAFIQVSRLLFGLGRLSEAFKLAEQARRRAPQDPLINTTWGFLLLARGKVQEAIAAFDQAIQADSTRGEPHLGWGLALFRRGKTEEAVQEMRMATLLEPQVSLFHSYLGKALYEVKRDEPARDEFALAKGLDPRDPTSWFYDAIRKQSVNRPVEALHDLQKSIELNDNRAVYRSRLLLDRDLAARGATLGRIYNDLGFQQLALVEGWRSLNIDPGNYSAHRFLADSYAALPRHEIARVSELLQSQLLQPINLTPVQPQLAESKLFILDGAGPAEPSLNEFNPLFVRNRFALLASGTVGGNDTIGDELVHSGVWGKVSYSLGQFHYETDGFRKNNDLRQDIYNAFAQVSLSPDTSVQAEFRSTDTGKGDRPLRFNPNDFLPNLRQERETDAIRLGFHHALSPQSDIIASVIYASVEDNLRDRNPVAAVGLAVEEGGYLAEVQHLFRTKGWNLISGVGHLTTNSKETNTIQLLRLPRPPSSTIDEKDTHHTNLYVYSQLNFPKNITLTLGSSADFFDGAIIDRDQFNPKVGLTWNPFPATTLRAAVFRVLKRRLISDQTIELTQVAGFNQFFDDVEGTESWRYGGAIDQKLSANIYAGAEFSKRDLEVPFRLDIGQGIPQTREVHWKEYLARSYLYWTPHRWLATGAEYQFEQFDRDPQFAAGTAHVETHRVPIGINFFHPWGFRTRLRATYVDQEGRFQQLAGPGTLVPGRDRFWVVDAAVGYRLPKRWGLITLEMRNLFDEKFKFQDTDPANPVIQPGRLIFARLTLAF
jgi:tetratricopeptide (TPR) repeat protein